MHGLFILGFPKLTRFLAHHDAILAKFLPKLKKHFDQCNLDSILYSLKWFFVIFIERVSWQVENRILSRNDDSCLVSAFSILDTIQFVFESLGYLFAGRRESCNSHGIYSIKGAQEQTYEA